MDVLHVPAEHLSAEQSFGDVRIEAVIGGIPVTVVEVPQQQQVGDRDRNPSAIRPCLWAVVIANVRLPWSGS
jgi:hypothetical protein